MEIKFKTVDVRAAFGRGEDPLALIRARVAVLTPGCGLTVIAPCLPAPLVELLRSEGFRSAVTHRGDGSWAVDFWKE